MEIYLMRKKKKKKKKVSRARDCLFVCLLYGEIKTCGFHKIGS